MYIMNATIKAIDDQNESITISGSCVNIDENSGTVIVYTDITPVTRNVNGSQQTVYTIKKVPCTIYRNLKKLTIQGEQKSWKYIKFKSN